VSRDGTRSGAYWTVPDGAEAGSIPLNEAVDGLEERLARSVRMQLLSDRKVGCQLSGGVDSSVVNLLAVKQGGAQMDAFSIVFDDPRFSEEPWIDEAARTAGVHSHRFRLTADAVVSAFERCTWHLDRPITHPNSIGIDHLSRHASEHVTVLLSGEGADEVFGGYNRYLWALVRPRLKPVYPLISRLPGVGRSLRGKFGDPGQLDDIDWFIHQSGAPRLDLVAAARPDGQFDVPARERRALFAEGQGTFLQNCLKYDLRTYLVDLLIRQDKMTMAHSLENRVPFLDHELVEHVRSLPTNLLVDTPLRPGQFKTRGTKILLRKLARRYFDDRFVYRPKVGFTMPLQEYFRDSRFGELMADDLLPGMKKRGLVHGANIEKLWQKLSSIDAQAAEVLWSVIALEMWARQFVDRQGPFVGAAPA
jgi:asparagine synthase (glutamine-hydrolysing)